MTGARLGAVFLVVVTALGLLSIPTAIAQYPEPVGNITLTPAESSPEVGSSVQITVKLVDAAGADLSGATCTASIASQPGSDASVSPSEFTSGGSGEAELTVQTGSTSGAVHVTVECDPRSANVVLAVGGEEAASGPADEDDGGSNVILWIIIAVVLALVALALAWLLRSRRTQNPA